MIPSERCTSSTRRRGLLSGFPRIRERQRKLNSGFFLAEIAIDIAIVTFRIVGVVHVVVTNASVPNSNYYRRGYGIYMLVFLH